MTARARAALAACGTQSTGNFQGTYAYADAPDPERPAPTLEIARDRIVVGAQTYCLSGVIERDATGLHAEAIVYRDSLKATSWLLDREDGTDDPETLAGRLLYDVRLNRGQQATRLRLAPLADRARARTLPTGRAVGACGSSVTSVAFSLLNHSFTSSLLGSSLSPVGNGFLGGGGLPPVSRRPC